LVGRKEAVSYMKDIPWVEGGFFLMLTSQEILN
jgi:hypothetical protein